MYVQLCDILLFLRMSVPLECHSFAILSLWKKKSPGKRPGTSPGILVFPDDIDNKLHLFWPDMFLKSKTSVHSYYFSLIQCLAEGC